MAAQPSGKDDLRGLKALVGGLGVLVVLGTAVVIAVVIQRLYGKPRSGAPETAITAPVLGTSTILRPGEHIRGIAGAGDALAIWVTGPTGERILLLDPATGRLIQGLTAPP